MGATGISSQAVTATHQSVCPHDCPSACSLSVSVEDGRLVDVGGDPDHPFKVADMGGGPAFHSTQVEVERAEASAGAAWQHLPGPPRPDPPPPVTPLGT